jgi:hypothetical protein
MPTPRLRSGLWPRWALASILLNRKSQMSTQELGRRTITSWLAYSLLVSTGISDEHQATASTKYPYRSVLHDLGNFVAVWTERETETACLLGTDTDRMLTPTHDLNRPAMPHQRDLVPFRAKCDEVSAVRNQPGGFAAFFGAHGLSSSEIGIQTSGPGRRSHRRRVARGSMVGSSDSCRPRRRRAPQHRIELGGEGVESKTALAPPK